MDANVLSLTENEAFISDVRLPAVSLGLRLCASREGGTGGGGWVSAPSLGSMAASGQGTNRLIPRPHLVSRGQTFRVGLAPRD